MIDFVQRFVFDSQDVRGCIVRLDETCQAIQATHHYPEALACLINQFAVSAVLLRDTIKVQGTVSIQLRTNGAISLLMADCFDDHQVRAIAEYNNEQLPSSPTIDLSDMGAGAVLAITITPDDGERYQGIVPIESNDLAACLEDYFARSEQLPTWFKLIANTEQATGIALHALPSDKISDADTRAEQFNYLKVLLTSLSEKEGLELASEEILTRLFHQEECRLFEQKAVEFGCQCSQQKSLDAILALGKDEVVDLVNEQIELGNTSIAVDCHFCFQRYEIDLAGMQQSIQNTGH